jgi:hypothetical protein
MRILFSILSMAYIIGIFLLADSSVVSDLAPLNPYSLLHIPLYGILTFLLIFSFVPLKFKLLNSINPINLSREMRPALWSVKNYSIGSLFHWDSTNAIHSSNLNARFLLAASIASVVAIADEIHQAYVPGRDASITDVLLDMVGIALVLVFAFRLFKTKTSLTY